MHYVGIRPQAVIPDPSLYRPLTSPLPPSQIDGSGDREREERVEERRSRSRSRDREREISRERDRRHDDYDSDNDWRAPIIRRYEVDSSPVYSFSPSRTSRGVSTQGSRYEEDNSSEKVEAEAGPRMEKRLPRASHAFESQVFESQYTGESCLGGLHAANLTVVTNKKVQYPPLFQWM